jgi:hypothetical protein
MATVVFKFELGQLVITPLDRIGVVSGIYTDIGGNQYHVRTVGSSDYWYESQLVLAD